MDTVNARNDDGEQFDSTEELTTDLEKQPKKWSQKWFRQNIWWPIHRLYKNIYYFFYNIPHRVRTLWWYTPLLCKDFDWSSHFLIYLIERKLQRMQQFNQHDSYSASFQQDADEIGEVLRLIKQGHLACDTLTPDWKEKDEWVWYREALEYMLPRMGNWGD